MTDLAGSILELKRNNAIVMTDTCDFVMIKRQSGMFVGQQVKFRKSDIKSPGKSHIKYLALAASVFVIVFSYALYYQFFTPATVFAYIDVDINPSMEFVIDKNAQVLEIKPLNKDSQTLLKDLKLVDLPVKQAIAEVVKESKQQGFIKPDKKNAVLIAASIDTGKNYKPNGSEEKVLDNILTDLGSALFDLGNEKIKPEVFKVTPEYRSFAVKNNISMGRYALYDKIKQKNNITIEEAKTSRVSDMLDQAQINGPADIKPEADNDNDTQINKEDNENNYGTAPENTNNEDETTKSGNDSLNNKILESEKDNLKYKNEETKVISNDDSNAGTAEVKNDNAGQGSAVNPANNEDEAAKSGNDSLNNNTLEEEKNNIGVKNEDTQDADTDNSNTGTAEVKNEDTQDTGTDNSNTGTVGDESEVTQDTGTDNSNTGTTEVKNGNTDQSTAVTSGNEQDEAALDEIPDTSGEHQEPDGQDNSTDED